MSKATKDLFIRLYKQDYVIIKNCCEDLNDEDLWRETPEGVSIANLICHVCEMETFWIDGGLCGDEIDRDRQKEFDRKSDLNKEELIKRINDRNQTTINRINDVKEDDMMKSRIFHGDDFTGEGILFWHIHHLGLHRGHIQAHTRWLKQK